MGRWLGGEYTKIVGVFFTFFDSASRYNRVKNNQRDAQLSIVLVVWNNPTRRRSSHL